MRRVKNNCKLTSKKCLTLSSLLLLLSTSGIPLSEAAVPPANRSVDQYLLSDLTAFRQEKRTDFSSLIEKWERVYGEAVLPTLGRISKDPTAKDSDRYVAILAATKIQGPKSAADTMLLLGDKNWMVRSAALKSIEILGHSPAGPKVLEILAKDPALVIRLQAIETLLRLRPEGTAKALVAATLSGQNYRPANFKKGRADWVPQRALEALRTMAPDLKSTEKSHTISLELLALLNGAKDGRIRAHALHTIETLEAKTLRKGRPFAERVIAWNKALR